MNCDVNFIGYIFYNSQKKFDPMRWQWSINNGTEIS